MLVSTCQEEFVVNKIVRDEKLRVSQLLKQSVPCKPSQTTVKTDRIKLFPIYEDRRSSIDVPTMPYRTLRVRSRRGGRVMFLNRPVFTVNTTPTPSDMGLSIWGSPRGYFSLDFHLRIRLVGVGRH